MNQSALFGKWGLSQPRQQEVPTKFSSNSSLLACHFQGHELTMAQPAVVADDAGEVRVEQVLQEGAAGDGNEDKDQVVNSRPGCCISQPAF